MSHPDFSVQLAFPGPLSCPMNVSVKGLSRSWESHKSGKGRGKGTLKFWSQLGQRPCGDMAVLSILTDKMWTWLLSWGLVRGIDGYERHTTGMVRTPSQSRNSWSAEVLGLA
jgi:hypothetical protein